MNREELERLFRRKIRAEMAEYRRYMQKKSKKELFDAAPEIESIRRIYGLCLGNLGGYAEGTLEDLLVYPNLLLFFYRKWLGRGHSAQEELSACMEEELQNLENRRQERKERSA